MSVQYLNGIVYGGIATRGLYACDLLYRNTNYTISSGTSTIWITYTLNKSIDDYDAVLVTGYMFNSSRSGEAGQSQLVAMLIPKYEFYARSSGGDVPAFILNGSIEGVTRRLYFGFSDSTHILTGGSRSTSYEQPVLYEIYGFKFGNVASSFFSGTTVPDASLGENGNIYVQTDANGTEMENMYFKVNGTWIPMLANGNTTRY